MESANVHTNTHFAFIHSRTSIGLVVAKGTFWRKRESSFRVYCGCFGAHVHLTLRQINLLIAQEGLQNYYLVFFFFFSVSPGQRF